MSIREGAGATRALASLRARPSAAILAAIGLALVGLMVGAAVTLGVALSTGFDRAQRQANSPDVTARFDPVERAAVLERLGGLANVESQTLRLVIRGVGMVHLEDGAPTDFGGDFRGKFHFAELNAINPDEAEDGLAIVEGRGLSGRPGEIVIERGIARAWEIGPGARIRLARGRWLGTVVGVSVEPDNVAYPLASEPRVYVAYDEVLRDLDFFDEEEPITAVSLRLADPDRLPETLVQARASSFGLTGTTFTTRRATQALINQAGGLVVALLTAFASIALIAATTMLASTGHARVTRDLPTIGALRALGFSPRALAGSYALEAGIVAVVAAGPGLLLGALLVSRPTNDLLVALNEISPASPVGLVHLAAFALIVALAAAAAGWPALAATRQPIAASLAGAVRSHPRRARLASRPIALGARLALRRPGRLLASVLAVAAALATILLLLSLGRFLLEAQREPAALGERYSLIVTGGAETAARVRRSPGVALAVPRYETAAVDAFELQEPIQIIAFGEGREQVFPGRPLLEGRRAVSPGETEVGAGLAQSLGLGVGGTLVAQLQGGGEVRLRVAGIVQELTRDGRVAYTDVGSILAAAPDLTAELAVQVAPGVDVDGLQSTLRNEGLQVRPSAGVVPRSASFLATVVILLGVVGGLNSLVCAALVLLALVVLARERSETIGIMRTGGASRRDVWALLFGAGAVLVLLAVVVAYLIERLIFAPRLVGMVERYGVLALDASWTDTAAVALGGLAVAALTAALTARRYTRRTVAALLRAP